MFGKKEKQEDNENIDEHDEIQKISSRLESGENIVLVARQSRIRPGGTQILTPNTIFATDRRLIIRNPNLLGLREDIENYRYDSITSVKIEKGLFSSAIHLVIPGMTEMSKSDRMYKIWGRNDTGVIDAIPKDKAEQLYKIINDAIAKTRNAKANPAQSEDPLTVLKVRFAKGEITKTEFEEMKKMLE